MTIAVVPPKCFDNQLAVAVDGSQSRLESILKRSSSAIRSHDNSADGVKQMRSVKILINIESKDTKASLETEMKRLIS